jgi:hypothetical protein
MLCPLFVSFGRLKMYLIRVLITILILGVAIIGCGGNSDDKVSDVQKIDEQNPKTQEPVITPIDPDPVVDPVGLAMGFTPSKLDALKNSEFSADISVSNVIGLYGCFFDLTYDPKLLEAVEGSKGELLGDDTLSLFHFEPGVISAGVTRKSGVEGASGSGIVAHTKFKALAPGAAEVKIVFTENPALRTNVGKSVDGIEKIVINNLKVQIK